MRPTTKRRLLMLLIVLIVLVGGVGGFFFVRMKQLEYGLQKERADGLAAYQQGRYDAALPLLSDYVSQHKDDADALYALAVARSNVNMANGQHLLTAISYLNNFLDMRKGDSQGEHKLLELYTRVHWNQEILSLSNEILQDTPDDLPALRAKVNALMAQRNFNEALAVSNKINELAPLDLEGQRTTFSLLAQLKHPAAELLARAKAGLDKYPADPRFELLQASAYDYAGDHDNAQKFLLSAINRKAPDAEFVRLATKMLDGGGSYDLSQQVLDRAVNDLNDPAVLKMLVERDWQNGLTDDMVTRLASVKSDDPKADTNLLAMKAISLLEHNQPAEALVAVKQLSTRTLDDQAFAWSTAIPAKYAVPAPNPRDAVLILNNAANRDATNSVIRLWLGEAYAKLNENELAINAWRGAASLEPAWAEPHVREASAMALSGRGSEAYDEALLAAQRAPKALGTRIAAAMALAALGGDDPRSVPASQLLQIVSQIQKDSPNEPQTLPMYVSLLTGTNQRNQALMVIKNAITANPALPTDTMLRLANVSSELKLDQQQAIYDAMVQAGNHSPELALARAKAMLAAGQADQGLQVMKDSGGSSPDAAAQIATAQYLDISHNPGANIAWKNAVEQFPNDLSVQSAFLKSDTRASMRPVWAATIDRVKNLSVEEGVVWRVEHAKYLLSGDSNDRDRAEAVTTLNELIHTNPDLVEPRLLLATTLIKTNNNDRAIEQLKFAAQLRPGDPQIALTLARLLLDSGKTIEGQAYLDKLANGGQLSPAGMRVVAQMMAEQGQPAKAIQVLQSNTGVDPSRDALIAQLYSRIGKNDDAVKLFAKLATAKPITTDAITTTADYYYAAGQPDQAKAVLARLSEATDAPDAGEAELIRAQMADEYQSPDVAKALYVAATQAAPNAATWRALAAFQIRQHDFAGAKASVTQALAVAKNDSALNAMAKLIDTAAAVPAGVDVNDELAALSNNPLNASAQDLFDAEVQSAAAKEFPNMRVPRYKAIYAKYPKNWPVNRAMIEAYMDANQLDNARQMCVSAAAAFPNETGPLQMLAHIYSSQNDWNAELATVQQWRSRSLNNQRPCDVAAAEAMIGLGQRRQAIATLQPYIATAKQDPTHWEDVLGLYARALLQDNKNADVATLLDGPVESNPSIRRLWLSLVGDVGPDNAAAAAWIEKVTPKLDANSSLDQEALARAWFTAAQRYNAPSSYAKANTLLNTLANKPDADPFVWDQLGEGLRAVNDMAGAENAYRQAMLRGDIGYAGNALAFLLLMENKSLDEALALASKAIDASPHMAGYFDTRGQIYLHLAKYDLAISDFDQAISLQSDLTDSMVGKAQALKLSGQNAKAAEMMKYIDVVLSRQPNLSPYAAKQLAGLKAASAN